MYVCVCVYGHINVTHLILKHDFDMSHINHYLLVSPYEHTLFNIKTSSKLIIILNCFISKTNIKYKKSYVLN